MENIKINSIKNLGKSKFEIIFRENGNSKNMVVTDNRHWVEELNDYISTISSDNPEFYRIWGHLEFRKKVCQKIQQFYKAPELKAA